VWLWLALSCAPPIPSPDGIVDDTATGPVPDCPSWSLVPTQSFDAGGLFADAPLAERPEPNGPGVVLVDLDGDEDLDAVYAINDPFSVGLRNDGTGRLEVDPTISLVDGSPLPVGVAVVAADLNADGAADLAIGAPLGVPDVVLTNDGTGRFTMLALPGSEGETMGVTLADLDGDGRLDLLTAGFDMDAEYGGIVAGEHMGDGSGVWMQQADHSWADGRDRLPDHVLYDLSYHFAALDAEGDGDTDLFLSNDYGSATGFPSYFLTNDGTGHYSESPDSGTQRRSTGMGAAVGDPDGNGAPDLYVANWGANFLYLNRGNGQFYDAAEVAGVQYGPNGDEGISYASRFADLDGDGWEDLLVAYGVTGPFVTDLVPEAQPDRLWRNTGGGSFEDISDAAGFVSEGWGRGLATGDLDGDGRLDVVLAERIGLRVYLGAGGCSGPSLRLDAGPGNPIGLGTRVDVSPEGFRRTWTRWVWPSSTYSQSDSALVLGLGGAPSATLRVTWPDGRQTEAEIGATDRLVLTPDP